MTTVHIPSKPVNHDADHGANSMPMSITELEPIVRDFVEKLKSIKAEQELLKQDEKDLVEKFSQKVDMKTLKAAMKVVAVREKVDRKETFDTLCEVLERVGT